MNRILTSVILISNIVICLTGYSQTWNSVGTGVNNSVYAFTTDTTNSELYVGGFFSTAGGISAKAIAMWNGLSWSDVGGGLRDSVASPHVRSLMFFNGKLCVGGSFDSAGTVRARNIVTWDGNNWDSIGSGFLHGSVMALAEYNGELYAGGDFDSSGTTRTNHIAKWNGTNWVDVGGGADNSVLTFCVFNNELALLIIHSSFGRCIPVLPSKS